MKGDRVAIEPTDYWLTGAANQNAIGIERYRPVEVSIAGILPDNDRGVAAVRT